MEKCYYRSVKTRPKYIQQQNVNCEKRNKICLAPPVPDTSVPLALSNRRFMESTPFLIATSESSTYVHRYIARCGGTEGKSKRMTSVNVERTASALLIGKRQTNMRRAKNGPTRSRRVMIKGYVNNRPSQLVRMAAV